MVDAVVLEGRSPSELARSHQIVAQLGARAPDVELQKVQATLLERLTEAEQH